jgi:hypothetical protein
MVMIDQKKNHRAYGDGDGTPKQDRTLRQFHGRRNEGYVQIQNQNDSADLATFEERSQNEEEHQRNEEES